MPGFLGTPAGMTTKSASFKAVARSSFPYPVTCGLHHKAILQLGSDPAEVLDALRWFQCERGIMPGLQQ